MNRNALDRRGFLKITGTAALGTALWGVFSGIARPIVWADEGIGTVALLGIPSNRKPQLARSINIALQAVDNGKWLKKGQSVAIRVGTNSIRPYPFATHPEALKEFIVQLRKRGAGRIVVAGQPGMDWMSPGGAPPEAFHPGMESGLAVMEKNGIAGAARAAKAQLMAFDLGSDWKKVEASSHWPDGFRIPKLFDQVDHIVTLSAPGDHIQYGHSATLGPWEGWLHPMDRLRLNADLKRIPERLAEVAEVLESRTRVHVLVAIEEFVDLGPDWGSQALSQGAIMVSTDSLALELVGAALVTHEKYRKFNGSSREPGWAYQHRTREEAWWADAGAASSAFHGTPAHDPERQQVTKDMVHKAPLIQAAKKAGLGTTNLALKTGGDLNTEWVGKIRKLTGGSKGRLGIADTIDRPGEDK